MVQRVQQQYPEVSGFSTIPVLSIDEMLWHQLYLQTEWQHHFEKVIPPSRVSGVDLRTRYVLGMICVGATRGFSALTKKLRRVAFMSLGGDIKLSVPGIWDLAFSRILLATIVVNPSGGDKNKHSKYCHNS